MTLKATIANGTPSVNYGEVLKQQKDDRSIADRKKQVRSSRDVPNNQIDPLHGSQGLIVDILEASATKRDAKAYIKRFGPRRTKTQADNVPPPISKTAGINLGAFFAPVRAAIDQNTGFASSPMRGNPLKAQEEEIHVALVNIRAPQKIDDTILLGVLHTLEQLSGLGMQIVVIVDCKDETVTTDNMNITRVAAEQVDRIVGTIDGLNGKGARRLDSVINFSSNHYMHGGSWLRVTHRDLLLSPLRKGLIPVLAPIAFNAESATNQPVACSDITLALTREFAGLSTAQQGEQDDDELGHQIEKRQNEISLDRVILLDPLGGTPYRHQSRAHRFINLEQEYDDLKISLMKYPSPASLRHADNLSLMKSALDLLPPSSSGFITTPSAVARSDTVTQTTSPGPTVGTRRQRNPLIHNLLTDKPAVSFSLPQHRLEATTSSAMGNTSTLLKRGMSLTIVPDHPPHGWTSPPQQRPSLQAVTSLGLRDPKIDYQRLTYLINDSFGRTLDVKAYDERTRNTLAGVIIAGDYQGAAIFTWEQPPPAYNLGAPNHPWVPYLDKFAVLRSAQGSATADILWNAMTQAFPRGFCWRSRTVNPVNKWYFERSQGSWELPGTQWTMFWSTKGVFDEADRRHWNAFLGVCQSVTPSWIDRQAVD